MEFEFIKRKAGPLPVWAWMGVSLAVVLAIASWRRATSKAADAPRGDAIAQQYALSPGVQPTYTFIDQDRTYVTLPNLPPSGGRPPAPTTPAPRPGPLPPERPETPNRPPTPAPPRPAPAPPAPAGQWVTVTKYAKGQPPKTPSTLWGIAELIYNNGQAWGRIWNAPQNADLRARRGAPGGIQPGDRFFVPQ